MKVSIIIPNCNGEKFIEECLSSLGKQTEKNFKTIIVDNASSDNSLKLIGEQFEVMINDGCPRENLLVVRNDENTGFCKAVNQGINLADTPYVILLNNDTRVREDFVEQSLKAIEDREKVFSVSPKMVQIYNESLIDNAGDGYTLFGWTFTYGKNKPVSKCNKEREVFTACAGAAIYQTEVLKQLGLFDENHFAYLEDVDIGYRARIHGYKNLYNPKAVVYHAGSAFSGSRYNEFKIKNSARNNIFLIYKNMPLLQIIFNFIFIFVGCVIKYLFFLMKSKEYAKAYIAGIKEGFASHKKCKKVKFKFSNMWNYTKIQISLIINLFRGIMEKF